MAQFDEPKGKISLLVGILITALGIIPLLNRVGVLGFNLPEFILKLVPAVAIWIIPAAGFFLFIDAFDEDDTIRTVTIIVAFLLIVLGIIQILNQFGVIGFGLPLTDMVYYIAFVVEGLFLIIATFAMF
ncbi:hypothetical protein GF367_01670 [Candidatus Woesearchaeota archaeon]|nr:hypothetical protein [Candidatus Woesearchaeota archaeon]